MLIKSSNFCIHGYLVARGRETGRCPECSPRAPPRPADPGKPLPLSELPAEIRTVRCRECGLLLRRTRWHTWKPIPGQPRVNCCERGTHTWLPYQQPVNRQGGQADHRNGGIRAEAEQQDARDGGEGSP